MECCRQAIDELASLPCIPKTRVNGMGREMGLLREKYEVDAPGGWYRVMKELRAMVDRSADRFQLYENDSEGAKHQIEDGSDDEMKGIESYESNHEDSGIIPPGGCLVTMTSGQEIRKFGPTFVQLEHRLANRTNSGRRYGIISNEG